MNDLKGVIRGVKPIVFTEPIEHNEEIEQFYPIRSLKCLVTSSDVAVELFKSIGLYQYLETHSWISQSLAKQLSAYLNQLVKIIIAKASTLATVNISENVDLLRLADIYVKSFSDSVYTENMGEFILTKASRLVSDYM